MPCFKGQLFLGPQVFQVSTSVDKSGEDLNHILSFLSCTVVKPLGYRNSKNPIQNAINVCLKVFGKFMTETSETAWLTGNLRISNNTSIIQCMRQPGQLHAAQNMLGQIRPYRSYSGVLVLDTCRLPLLRQHPRFCTANWAAALVRENFFGARRANTALVWTYFAQSRLNVTLLWAERAHKWCWTGSSRFLHLH